MSLAPHLDACLIVTGPTASGKSAVGIELARRIGGEILSLDSMAVYRGMDIGTAKPSPEQRAAVPHHLIDVVSPQETFSLAQYVAAAQQGVNDILARNQRPIFVGGTPLYLKALLRGMFTGPEADWTLRARLTAETQLHGNEWLHAQVAAVDPQAAKKLHPQDTKRLIRVLEVYEKTGRAISELQSQFERPVPREQCRVYVLDGPREELYARINRRVEAMFAAGLVDEVRGLLDAALSAAPASPRAALPRVERGDLPPLSHTARQALGYREVIEHLEGQHSLSETIELVQNRTRAFARRQLTWFRSLSECRWLACSAEDNAASIALRIVADPP